MIQKIKNKFHSLLGSLERLKFVKKLKKIKFIKNALIYYDLLRIENTVIIASKPIKYGLAITIFFFGGFVLWGMFFKIESAAIAQGTVSVASNNKIIQHLEGGIIKDILIKDGDLVEIGQPLIILDETITEASLGSIQKQKYALKLKKYRLKTEISNNDNAAKFTELKDMAQKYPELQEIYQNESDLLQSHKEQYQAEKDLIQQKVIQAEEEIKGFEKQALALKSQLSILESNLNQEQELLKQGYSTITELNDVKRQMAFIDAEIGENLSNLAKARLKFKEAELEKTNYKINVITELNEELKLTLSEQSDLDRKDKAAQSILDRHIITAPQSGKITKLNVHTIGGIISPRAEIMEIVPQNDKFIIKAEIDPKDIDVVHEGLSAQVKLTSFNLRNLSLTYGNVISISADKILDERTDKSYYSADISIDGFDIPKDISTHIYPGMPATIFIVTGKRTFFEYLFEPLKKTMQHSFKES